jgi:hypothetical protein
MSYFPTAAVTPEWDSITFVAGQTQVDFASTAVDVGGTVGSKWDVAEAPGTDGAKVSFQGYTPAKISLSWKLWNADHFSAYDRLTRTIMPKPGKQRPAPVLVLHPLLQMHGLREFVIESLEIPKADGKRIWTASAKLVENFKKPKPSATKPAAASNVLDAVNALNAKRKAAAAVPGAGTQPKPNAPASPRATGNKP